VLLDRFRPAAALDLIERERVTYIPTAPAVPHRILAGARSRSGDVSSLRIVVRRGASAGRAHPGLAPRRGPVSCSNCSGMLETGYQAYTRATMILSGWGLGRAPPPATWASSWSTPTAREVARGAGGRYLLRWTLVASRYYIQPTANAEAFLRTAGSRSGLAYIRASDDLAGSRVASIGILACYLVHGSALGGHWPDCSTPGKRRRRCRRDARLGFFALGKQRGAPDPKLPTIGVLRDAVSLDLGNFHGVISPGRPSDALDPVGRGLC